MLIFNVITDVVELSLPAYFLCLFYLFVVVPPRSLSGLILNNLNII